MPPICTWTSDYSGANQISMNEIEEIVLWEDETLDSNVESRYDMLQKAYCEVSGQPEELHRYPADLVPTERLLRTYTVSGSNPGEDDSYWGLLHLSANQEGDLKAIWEIGKERSKQYGEGFRHEHYLVINFREKKRGGFTGQAIYEMHADGKIRGYWLQDDIYYPGREVLE